MKILSVDTSATAASVALSEEGKLIGETFINTSLTHSQTLIPMVEQLLNNTKTEISDIDAIAVNAGPGSFTGVRIGVAAVKVLLLQIIYRVFRFQHLRVWLIISFQLTVLYVP